MAKLFYKDKPIIGLDISTTGVKVMAIDAKKLLVLGYGSVDLEPSKAKEALETNIGLEDRRKSMVALAAENAKAEADARAYGVSSTMKALGSVDPKILQALASTSMKPEQLIAYAFQELAGKAEKIGQLNISPDLLRELMTPQPARK